MNKFGFYHYLHYEKPRKLDAYSGDLRSYQETSFVQGFELIKTGNELTNFIFDRFHLGEAVYSHRYRGYDGNYVFDIEKEYEKYLTDVRMILLITSDFSFILDDGLSFDFDKKHEEQNDFIEAFHKSIIKNKVIIDVADGYGGFKKPEAIFEEAFAYVPPFHKRTMYDD